MTPSEHLIAVISDTHNRVPRHLLERLSKAAEIWHLGDVCEAAILDELSVVGVPLEVVRGNNDFDYAWPLTRRLVRGGVRFHLEHIPPRFAPRDCDVVLHGHTHVPRDERSQNVRWLNPGAVSYANRGAPASFAWLKLQGEGKFTWDVELLEPASKG